VRLFGGDTKADERTETDAEAREAEAREAERTEATERRTETVEERRPAYGVAAARDRFGGIDLPASFVGMLTALALVAILGSIVGAIVGAVGYQTGLDEETVEDISIASLIGGLVILFLAYLVGGWAAGRIARYDGAINGLMTGIWTIVLAAILSALAAWGVAETNADTDVLRNVNLPQWFSQDALTTGAIISGAVAVAVMLLAGLLGGAAGALYHRRADATITGDR
jgi:hypothetical protein